MRMSRVSNIALHHRRSGSTRGRWIVTAALALMLGGVLAWYAVLIRPGQQALAGIVATDATARSDAWAWLLANVGDGQYPRLARFDDAINRALQERGPDSALRDAADVLRAIDAWTWSRRGERLVLRELHLRAQDGTSSQVGDVADAIIALPQHIEPAQIVAICQHMLERQSPAAWRNGLRAAAGWLGVERAAHLAHLQLPPLDKLASTDGASPDDVDAARFAIHRTWWLLRSWGGMRDAGADGGAAVADDAAAADRLDAFDVDGPVDVLEAQLLCAVRSDPEDISAVLDVITNWQRDARPAFAHILRYAADARARTALERLSRAGDRAAELALAERSEIPETNSTRRVAADSAAEPSLRRLAGWRLDRLGDATIESILESDPLEPDGSAYAAALVAERLLDHDAAVARSETWLRSLDPAFVRVGALLAALLGTHDELVAAALEAHTDGQVRTTLRVALIGLRRDRATADDRAFLHRAMHRDGDRFNPEAMMGMLMIGETDALAVLTTSPRGEWRLTVQPLAWLIERFLPTWHARAGRPMGGDAHGYRLHFDQLDALRLLTQRRLTFDARRLELSPTSSPGHRLPMTN